MNLGTTYALDGILESSTFISSFRRVSEKILEESSVSEWPNGSWEPGVSRTQEVVGGDSLNGNYSHVTLGPSPALVTRP
jgi:hypothetical protein